VLIRKAAVAGGFYSRDRDLLKGELERAFSIGYGPLPKMGSGAEPVGAVVPHAGYTYSGAVASYSYGFLRSKIKPDSIIIVGPNHTGYGSDVSVWAEGEWESPLGSLKVDDEIGELLLKRFPDFDPLSHRFEHSIEVQIPFIQYVYGFDVKIVPVCVLDQSPQTMLELGSAIADVVRSRRVVLLASSDLSHYESHEVVSSIDSHVINAILEMNEKKIYEEADEFGVSACGLGPIVSVVHAMKLLRNTQAQLLQYSTSGEVTGDYTSVVGYASIVFR
jgi:AmmeMemoRadiSam system protein B